MKGIYLILIILLLPLSVAGQILITTVDENLQPLAEVEVVYQTLAGEQKGKTDSLGRWSSVLSSLDQIQLFSFGYKTIESSSLSSGNYTFVFTPFHQQLDEVVVDGFNNRAPLTSIAGSVRKLSASELNRFDQLSLVRPLNLIPGLRFEERAMSSYRVSIRGSSLRSPFGVRNVKIYWNGIPFTDPGGNTFVNLLDRQNMNGLEVIKGPAGSFYGAGTGGVIKIKSTDYPSAANSLMANMTVGSYNLQRYALQYNTLNSNSSWTAKLVHHRTDGYREHNKSEKTVFEMDGLIFSGSKRTIGTSILYTDLDYQIPGGLNADQFAEDPRQSRPRSIEQNSSIDHQMLLLRLGQEYQFSSMLKNETQFFGTFRKFENPFILDYKRDTEQRLGIRTYNQHDADRNNMRLTYGLEYQTAFFDGKNFGNREGESDTIRFADEILSSELIAFAGFQINSGKWRGEFDLSFAKTSYQINRTVDRIGNDPRSFDKSFKGVINPRVAISRKFNPWINTHFSLSSGYSVPTTSEVRTNEGSLNTGLEAERGLNYELNLRGGSAGFSYDLAFFHFDLTQSITTYTNPDGVVLFRNAGAIQQNGVELELKKSWISQNEGFVSDLSSSLAYTYHDFEFGDYENRGNDLSGNALTGTAPHVVGFTTDIKTRAGLFMNFSYLFTDEIPLNDDNTVYAESFQLIDLKMGLTRNWGKTMAQLSLGFDNLLDENYSLGNDLNAFGGRYFQPAPGRNFFVQLTLKFDQ
jgi:iron complex outermembrane receptor protein